MPTQIFVSLPVRNLQDSTRFYESLGYRKNSQFSDETVSSFDISETIHLMLATHEKFRELTPTQIGDPSKVCHSLLSLSCESREEVDSIVSKAIAAVARRLMIRKIMALCTSTVFTISMVTDGACSGLLRLRSRNVAESERTTVCLDS